jgi:hypothetical protein
MIKASKCITSLYFLGHVLALPHQITSTTSTIYKAAHPAQISNSSSSPFAQFAQPSVYSLGSLENLLPEISVPFSFQIATGLASIPKAEFLTSSTTNPTHITTSQSASSTQQGLPWPASDFAWPFRPGPPTPLAQESQARDPKTP